MEDLTTNGVLVPQNTGSPRDLAEADLEILGNLTLRNPLRQQLKQTPAQRHVTELPRRQQLLQEGLHLFQAGDGKQGSGQVLTGRGLTFMYGAFHRG